MGILGRPRRRKIVRVDNGQTAARETSGAALLRRQLTGSDPVLARVAEEALLAEAASRGKTKSGPQDPRICAGFNASICALPPPTRTAPRPYFGLTARSLRTCLGGLDPRENGTRAAQQRRGARGARREVRTGWPALHEVR